MYRFLIIMFLCLDAVLAQAHQLQTDTGTGERDTNMQYRRRFDFNQEQVTQHTFIISTANRTTIAS
jgi:hypothetical protein